VRDQNGGEEELLGDRIVGWWRDAEIMQDGSTELNNRLATSFVYL
jgi:hypothetical protein